MICIFLYDDFRTQSSEIPRMRQPQKVGFSIPEVCKRTSRKILVDAEVNVPTPNVEKL